MKRIHTQAEWMARARQVLPAGGFGNFDPGIVIREGKGSRVWDEDGNEYVDYLIGSGPMLLGHGHPEVMEVVLEQLPRGMTFFANNSAGIELAEDICEAVPCAEQVRYLASGGEADMYAIRAARAFTGRSKILKFEGGYHGMSAEAQMSLAPVHLVDFPEPVPDSAGIPGGIGEQVIISQFNDLALTDSLMEQYSTQLAAVIVEPLQRVIAPAGGFLQGLRDLCDRHGVLLIFDEIVTGFRLAYGGAQEKYGVIPDICTLGKIIGGGFPLAAIAGKRDIMDHFDKEKVGPEGFLMQLGTLSGNPVAAVAGIKTMEILRRDGQYDRLRQTGLTVQRAFGKRLDAAGHRHRIVGDQTLFDVLFTEGDVRNYRDMKEANGRLHGAFNAQLRRSAVLKSHGKCYPSLAISAEDIEMTCNAIDAAVASLDE